MANDVKIYSVQPKYRQQDYTSTWALMDGIFNTGMDIPTYGSLERDYWLATQWMEEPILAGAFSTWIERAQTVEWKVVGGRNNANKFAKMFLEANNGEGWSNYIGKAAIQYLSADHGSLTELGRGALDTKTVKVYEQLNTLVQSGDYDILFKYPKILQQLNDRLTAGSVKGIQNIDVARTVHYGIPNFDWRYYPVGSDPISFPNDNIYQIVSNPMPLDDYTGIGLSPFSRLLSMKELMLGYLIYFRQEIGNLPPEMAMVINGLSETHVTDSLNNYKREKENAGLDKYGKIWWLGSDDPSTPVSMTTVPLTSPTKSFNYTTIIEIWVKAIALNTGEDVGEYWLLQNGGGSKDVQSIQALKSRGKGVARFLSEVESNHNNRILPFTETFSFDNKDDEQDAKRAEILSKNIGNLKIASEIGLDREDPLYTMEEIRQLAVEWEITPESMNDDESLPTVVGSVLKSLGIGTNPDDLYSVDCNMKETRMTPMLAQREQEKALAFARNLEQTQIDISEINLIEQEIQNGA